MSSIRSSTTCQQTAMTMTMTISMTVMVMVVVMMAGITLMPAVLVEGTDTEMDDINGAGTSNPEGQKNHHDCRSDVSFKCDVSMTQCIDARLTCNGVAECQNGRDESVEICGCLPNEFQCNKTHCIDVIKRCDLSPDCDDESDEESCETYQCPSTHIKCKNHFCVPRYSTCDFVDDCGDNSDEENCDPRECYPTEFQCDNAECIPMTYLCDGQQDCKDGSDELADSCERHFLCPIGFYILDTLACDGWEDCIFTHADELNCRSCQQEEFRCHSSRCISLRHVCDGHCDCVNSCEDENGCENFGCGDRYKCKNIDRCIYPYMVCDGVNDCQNTAVGMDEYFCFAGNRSSCRDFDPHKMGSRPVQCNKSGQCVPESARCDHYADCVYGEDEEGCDFPSCAEGQFRCQNQQCVPDSARCDGHPDCFDRSDEDGCQDVTCPEGRKRCKAGGQCVKADQWCDHSRDCPDGSDEAHCTYRSCRPEEFRCLSGQCVDQDVVCFNGHAAAGRGCHDNSHLMNCSEHECDAGQFKCRQSYCVDDDQKCDGKIDCLMTFWDEHGCPFPCPHYDQVCVCQHEEMDCQHRNLTHLPYFHPGKEPFSQFYLTGNRLQLTADTFLEVSRMTILDLSNNSLKELPVGCFKNQWRLVSLNLEDNQLTKLQKGTFRGLSNLKTLFLGGNPIHTVEPGAFVGLASLTSLDLSYHRLTVLRQNNFVGLRNLRLLNVSHNQVASVGNGTFSGLDALLTLDISSNKIVSVEKNVFHGMEKLHTLYTDGFWFCCLAGPVPKCFPEPDEFSSCEDLMSNHVLRISIWVLGMVAAFGNLLVIGWRARDIRGGKVHSFLITNLAIGDFFMGVYLLIIAVVDSYYRGVYIVHDKWWRHSDLCRFSGFISTFSSELSVFTLTVITLDRLVCIIFPLKLKRLGLKQATLVMSLVWLGVFWLSVLPLLGWDYFREFYGRSGVCLALHVTPDRPAGWEYSVAVFLVINLASFLLIVLSYLWMFVIARQTRSAVRSSGESKTDAAMARRMTLIVMTDFLCWVPIILLGFASLGGARSSNDVYAWIAVFVLPLNSAINPVLYTISTAPFLGHVRKRASRFRKSFIGSFNVDNTKHTYVVSRILHTR
ncbi:G-protein coupled receptor GRL101-like [Babylonia areolata]|uniref:G-protein coupled receptor GRL101-like n=1 Tax=Babylonia areolata TaxID=304850 RepID=UPI003FD648D6